MTKTWKVMRLCVFSLMLFLSQAWATSGYSQHVKLNLNMRNAKILDVLDKIEENSEYSFLFNQRMVNVERRVDIRVTDKTVETVLKQLFNGTNVNYLVKGNQIVLTTRLKAQSGSNQQKSVTGKVTDRNGQPLPGVSIVIKGTTKGITTDVDGNYSIDVSAETILQFSFVGMKAQEILVGNQSVLNVVLTEDAIGLEEVVAIGYGTKSKETLTGATFSVKDDQFKSKPQTEVVQSLQGAIPGLMVVRGDGEIGNEGNFIQLRGVTSRNAPGVLIVVDGIPQRESNANALNNINPQDIEDITVLKDAQAAIYGARAAGGVILVTTKKGKRGMPTITYDANFSWNKPSQTPISTDVREHMLMADEAFRNDGNNNHFFSQVVKAVSDPNFDINNPQVVKGPFGDTPTIWLGHNDWSKVMWGTAFMQSHNIAVSGRTDKSNYYVSVGVLDQGSMLQFGKNSNLRYFSRMKYDFEVLQDLLTLGTNISLERQKIERPNDYGGIKARIDQAWTSMPLSNPEGNYYNFGGFTPPHAFAESSGDAQSLQYRARLQFNAKLTPIAGLTVEGQFATNLDVDDYSWKRDIIQFYSWDNKPTSRSTTKNGAGSSYRKDIHQVANLFANYKKSIGDHNASLTIGASHEEIDNRGFGASRNKLISDELNVLDLGDPEEQFTNEMKSQYAISSYFGRLSYDYQKKYMLDFQFRRDGSSRFYEDYRWGNFFGVSGAWVIAKENFLSDLNIFDNLKLRGSFGQLGNQNNVGRFDHFARIWVGGERPFGDPLSPVKQQYAAEVSPLASKLRTWETVNMTNYAVDFAVLDARLSGSIDYFIKKTKDVLISQEFPTTLGISPPTVNGGEIETKGWELAINWKDKIGDFEYFISGTYTDDRNKVVSLEDSKVVSFGMNSYREGYSTGSWFGLEYGGLITDQATLDEYKKTSGVPHNLRLGDVMWMDKDGDGVIERGKLYKEGDPDSGDLVYLGNNNIRHQFSLTLGASWKGFDFSAMFQGVGKWKVTNNDSPMGGNWWEQPWKYEYLKSWHADRPNATWPALTGNGGIDGWNWQTSDASFKMYNNAYVRLKNVQIGYTLPKAITERFKVSKLRIYVSGSDLWETHNLPKGFDPEKPFSFSFTPLARYFSTGINVTF
jgi:TonB-linked SusC/RagA family outer membrane protein